MPAPTSLPQSPASRRPSWTLLAPLVLGLALLAAYSNSFRVPFIFDDDGSISDNLTLRSWKTAFFPPGDSGVTVSGRPVLNASFALNYALGGKNVAGYHAVNLLIHFLGALTLFGIVRRTLRLPGLREKFASSADLIALSVSAIWALHPLQTESVTYIVQRAESLVGLFYLLTLYCFIRSTDIPASSRRWEIAAFIACLAGMGSKEVMVSAPIIIFLYDRTFIAGSFPVAWRSRRRIHLLLAASWLLLAACIVSTGSRGQTVGLAGHITWWHYLLTQAYAIIHYLRLTFWPDPLVLDYGTDFATRFTVVAAQFSALVVLALATLCALWKKPVLGFLGCVFFAVLAPTSSIVPVLTQTMAEHRVYLAIAPVTLIVVFSAYRLAGSRAFPACLVIALILGAVTYDRNRDYQSSSGIWEDNAVKAPYNVRAMVSLGAIYIKQGDLTAAEHWLSRALQIKPKDVPSMVGYGNILAELGQHEKAFAYFERALALEPASHDAHYNYGKGLLDQSHNEEAVRHLEAAVDTKPSSSSARYNLGNAYYALGRIPEAIAQYERVMALDPDSIDARTNHGNALITQGRVAEALVDYETALRQSPENPKVLLNLGRAHTLLGHNEAGLGFFQRAIAAQPDVPEGHANIASAYASSGRTAEALPHYRRALALGLDDPTFRIQFGHVLQTEKLPAEAAENYRLLVTKFPDFPDGHYALANLLLGSGEPAASIPHYQALLRLMPRLPDAHNNLGIAYAQLDRIDEARSAFEEAVRLKPDFEEARENLARVPAALAR